MFMSAVLYNTVAHKGHHIKEKEKEKEKAQKHPNIQPFLINIFQLHSNAARIYDYGAKKFSL